MLGTVLPNMPGMKDYVSRRIGAWTRFGRQTLAAGLLVGSVALAAFAACGESEPEATQTPESTAAPLVTAPARSPSPAPIPTPTPQPPPTATPAPTPTPTAQPAPQPVTPRTVAEAPTPEPTPEPTATPDAMMEAPTVLAVGVVIPQVGLNVRDAPSVADGAVQYVALQGEELELTDEISEIDGIVWRQLADGNWVQVQYLEISETTEEVMTDATPAATSESTTATVSQTIGIVVPEIGLNVRDAPSVVEGAIQYVALQGEELILTGQVVEAEDAVWYELEDGNWVQGQYLDFNP